MARKRILWRCCSFHDKAERRGIWYAENSHCALDQPYQPPTTLVLCAGREGDDQILALRAGETITPELLHRLAGVLAVGAWMQETEGPDTQHKPRRAGRLGSFKELCALSDSHEAEKQEIYSKMKGKQCNSK